MEIARRGVVYGLHRKGDPDNIRYIGKTVDRRGSKARLYGHVWLARNGSGHLPVQRWINKEGEGEIDLRVLHEAPEDELNRLEVEEIRKHRELGMADLNVTDGGDGMSSEQVSGEKNPRAKTTRADVDNLRNQAVQRYVSGEEAAKILGLTPVGASKVLTNRSWYDPAYDPSKRVTLEESVQNGGGTYWGRPSEKEVNKYRTEYLSGEGVVELTRKYEVPMTSMMRYLFERYGDEILKGLCNEERENRQRGKLELL